MRWFLLSYLDFRRKRLGSAARGYCSLPQYSLRFGLDMKGFRNQAFVRLPVGTRHSLEGIAFDTLPSLLTRGGVADTQDAVEERSCMAIPSHPEPEQAFFSTRGVQFVYFHQGHASGRAKRVNGIPVRFDPRIDGHMATVD